MPSPIQKIPPFLWVSSAPGANCKPGAANVMPEQGNIPELLWWLGLSRLWFTPKQLWQWDPWLAVTTAIAWHHLNLLFFFSPLVAHTSSPLLFPSQAAETSNGPCSPSALLRLSAGLEPHLEPWSYVKILKFFPNRIYRWEQSWCCIAQSFSLQTWSSYNRSSPWGGNPIILYS